MLSAVQSVNSAGNYSKWQTSLLTAGSFGWCMWLQNRYYCVFLCSVNYSSMSIHISQWVKRMYYLCTMIANTKHVIEQCQISELEIIMYVLCCLYLYCHVHTFHIYIGCVWTWVRLLAWGWLFQCNATIVVVLHHADCSVLVIYRCVVWSIDVFAYCHENNILHKLI